MTTSDFLTPSDDREGPVSLRARTRRHLRRLGQTWQDPAWRKARLGASDVTAAARAALARLHTTRLGTVHRQTLARTPAPFTGDARPADGPILVMPEVVRGFA